MPQCWGQTEWQVSEEENQRAHVAEAQVSFYTFLGRFHSTWLGSLIHRSETERGRTVGCVGTNTHSDVNLRLWVGDPGT